MSKSVGKASSPYLIPYVRNAEQFAVALELPYDEIYLELEDPRKYAAAVAQARAAEEADGRTRQIWVAPPRMFKSGEDFLIKQLLNCGADGFLARNHEHLTALADYRMRGDFSLSGITRSLHSFGPAGHAGGSFRYKLDSCDK